MKKNIIKIYIILISFFVASNSYANKIVFIDMDYILNQSIMGQNISQILEKEKKKTTDELNKIEKNLKIEEKQIISKKNILTDDQFRKLIQDFKIKVNNFNSEKEKNFNLLNKKKINLTKDFIDQIDPIFIEFVKKNSISIILKKKDILIGDTNLDKTLEFLNLVNEKINVK